ncbi:SDR family oxidoreductase [Magnetospirillum fulvum]|jgi:NAD(P)-dependent dehydrogenase (short-subunit alcohol dehydrogenase family)|uniref:Short chain dehydrogenase n=1 Tax=Magnetospirillum fulvum MGU-K5 TaxID=1316936 RepID=S9TFJ9_MAGFU|nr:SDR family oxidoreductase [Magnetospirillum fulvum]EPY01041.1 short chain dehydrogenase [Magnetospirillum fulvum MGU-K5]
MSASVPALFDLTGKVALITGASRGIGAAIARTLAASGAHVIVSSRKTEECETVAAAIRDSGGSAEALACHIGEMEQIESAFERISARHGRLHILVNNAATNPYFGPLIDTDLAAFQKTVDVNIRGYFFMSARGMKLIAASGGGSIVNVASVNGVRPAAGQGLYSMTKAAVISLTQACAQEGGPLGVRVNALLPGLTDTKFASALTSNPKILAGVTQRLPLGRAAQPDEMVGAVLFLVSPSASYTTGACLTVDGGYLVS